MRGVKKSQDTLPLMIRQTILQMDSDNIITNNTIDGVMWMAINNHPDARNNDNLYNINYFIVYQV